MIPDGDQGLAQREPDDDRLIGGCAMGCLSQVVSFAIGWLVATKLNDGKATGLILTSWGLTQWIGIIPLILRQRAKGRRRTVQGLILTGCIGLLLSSACATMILR